MRVKNDTVPGQDWNNEDKKKMEKKYSQHCCHDGIIQVMKMKGGRSEFSQSPSQEKQSVSGGIVWFLMHWAKLFVLTISFLLSGIQQG